VRNNLKPHKVPGYGIVEVSLKAIGEDARGRDGDPDGRSSPTWPSGSARTTSASPYEQNLVLPHVKLGRRPGRSGRAVAAAGLATPNMNLVSDIIACPGLDYCALGQRAGDLGRPSTSQRSSPTRTAPERVGELKVKISGCINACGHHHVGHIGHPGRR
jgi:sulfite reductase (NADPH) hemoprotein beta-component